MIGRDTLFGTFGLIAGDGLFVKVPRNWASDLVARPVRVICCMGWHLGRSVAGQALTYGLCDGFGEPSCG